MKQEIKERIEKIKKGVVPNGYKYTNYGIVPKNWTIQALEKLFNFKNGLNKESKYFGYGTPIVNYTDVFSKRGLFVNDIKGLVNVTISELERYNVQKGDILFTRTSETVNEIGLSSVILEELKNTVFSGFLIRARSKNNLLDLDFKKYCFSTFKARKEIVRKSSYTTRALTSGTLLNKVKILIPPLNEQKKIANILSTWDNAIELKEKLIEQKKKQKKGLMQLLLTGKKRLKGFTRQWKKVKLKEVGEIYQPETISNDMFTKVGYPVYGANGQIGFYDKYNHENWQILITCRGSTCGTVNKSEPKSWITGNAMVLNTDNNPNVNKNYIYYCCKNSNFNRIITGSGQPQITREPLANYTITIPVDIFEQEAIVNILLMAEKYIELLEQELEQIKRQKKGLMQLLLTGIVRVTD